MIDRPQTTLSWLLRSVVGVAGLVALYVRAHWLLAVVLVATVAVRALIVVGCGEPPIWVRGQLS